jgi:hypothetical protein
MSPHTPITRPAIRCHGRLRRRNPGENWTAPTMLYGMTARMCRITGMGCAKKRAFAGVTSASPANCASRDVPATAGTRLNTISSAGRSQSARRRGVGCFIVSARRGGGRP